MTGAATVAVGETITLQANVEPESATGYTVQWTLTGIDDSERASIDLETGAVTGIAAGEIHVTCNVHNSDGSIVTPAVPYKITVTAASKRKSK